jgi:3-hydroxyisobutyrate dehydrogenase-like beta-hydroxyacid dehydrogenase
MTKNLIAHGNLDAPLVIYNRTKQRVLDHSLAIGYSRVADSIEEAVIHSDIIWSCVHDKDSVEGIFNHILNVDIKRKLFVDSSTITPEKTNAIAMKVISAGGEFVALPGTPFFVFCCFLFFFFFALPQHTSEGNSTEEF